MRAITATTTTAAIIGQLILLIVVLPGQNYPVERYFVERLLRLSPDVDVPFFLR
jgi:hypothetical protein